MKGRISWPFLLLALVLVAALALRLHGVDWDQGYGFHPDERDIYMRAGCMYDLLTDAPGAATCGYLNDHPEAEPGLSGLKHFFNSERSPLNPHWFPLGSMLIYVMVFFRSVAELFTDMSAMDMRFIGRPLSALADVGTVLMVYLLARRFYSPQVGLLAAGLTALAVIHVQHSHFYRPETFSVFFTLATLWAMVRMVERRRVRDSVLLGVMLGLALAPKVNVLPLLAPLALVYWYRFWDEVESTWFEVTPELVLPVLRDAAVCGVVAVAVFFVTAPYAFIDFGEFVSDLAFQTRMANNAGLVPFTVQYVDTPAFFYQISQSSVWGLGLPLGIIAWVAVPITVVLAFTNPATRRADLLLLAWLVPGFLFLESFEVRFLRYVFPLMPVMIILASRMMVWLWENAHMVGAWLDRAGNAAGRYLPLAAVALIAGVVGFTAFYSLAFQRVYAEDHPALTASEWINENVPRGSSIVNDNHWDEHLPDLYRYDHWQFELYQTDTAAKMEELAERLSQSDYLVFYSNRPYSSAAQDPGRFPFSYGYYRRLFAGELGYRLEAEFTSYPQFAGVAFRDDALGRAGLARPEPEFPGQESIVSLNLGYADENVANYDHPRVLVFRNVDRRSAQYLQSLLLDPAQQEDVSSDGKPPLPAPVDPDPLMLSAEDSSAQLEGGTFSEIFNRESWTNRLPVLAWLLTVELIYLLALPLAMLVFRPLPDRGIVLGRILGLLGVSYFAWLIVSLGWADFSRTAVYLGMAVIAAASGLALAFHWRDMGQFLRVHWRLFLAGEILFLVGFLAFVGLRDLNPDLWHPVRGGEKPMELSYLTAVVRSTTLPPYDPWFAGGYLNYYYWGYFVIAGIVRVTGILPAVAFNLAVPLLFALTITGAYSVVYNLAERIRESRNRPRGVGASPFPDRASGLAGSWLVSPIAAGLLAALFVAVIGNLDGAVQIGQGLWHRLADCTAIPQFDFWRSSRMIPPLESFDPSPLAFWVPEAIPEWKDVSFHITEFPFFTFLFADLHPHMMVIPLTLLVIGLGVNLVMGLSREGPQWGLLALVALAVALGSLWAVNSWDYPSYALLVLALLGLAVYRSDGSLAGKALVFAAVSVGVVAVSLLAFLPFHQNYETFNNGIDASMWMTPVDRFLGIHAVFLFIGVTFLLIGARDVLLSAVGGLWGRNSWESSELKWLRCGLALAVVVIALLATAGYWNAVMLAVFLTLAAMNGWRLLVNWTDEAASDAVAVALFAMALLIAIGVDFVTVEGDIGRMNTVFKYYLEVWVLMSVAAAFMLWSLLDNGFLGRLWNWRTAAWLTVLALLIGSSLIYTALGSRERVDDRFASIPSGLDGSAYMLTAVHYERDQPIELKWDYEAIRWLQDNVEGTPVVLEAHMEQYRWGSRITKYTGLPTVLGWPWHQYQQRSAYDSGIRERANDTRLTYETDNVDEALRLLRKYGVTYVVYGDLERTVYGDRGLDKFRVMEGQGLVRLVFQNSGTSIYQVSR